MSTSCRKTLGLLLSLLLVAACSDSSPTSDAALDHATAHESTGEAFCRPSCGQRVCGPDPVCGSSCGKCAEGRPCSAEGQCGRPACTPLAPTTVDSKGNAGATSSMAVSADGKVHIAYSEADSLTLNYATNASGAWSSVVLDSGAGGAVSLALDGSGKLHLVYFAGELRYQTNASGAWVKSSLDTSGDPGHYPSLAVGPSGTVHLAYVNPQAKALKAATNASGLWQSTLVDSSEVRDDRTSVAIDGAGGAHLCYHTTRGHLKYGTNTSGTWQISTVDTGWGTACSLTLDRSGKAHVSDLLSTSMDLRYATNATGTWVVAAVDTKGWVGQGSSIGSDALGKAHISYFDETTSHLKHATNASGAWVARTIVSQEEVGEISSLVVDANDGIHVSYQGKASKTNGDLNYMTICQE